MFLLFSSNVESSNTVRKTSKFIIIICNLLFVFIIVKISVNSSIIPLFSIVPVIFSVLFTLISIFVFLKSKKYNKFLEFFTKKPGKPPFITLNYFSNKRLLDLLCHLKFLRWNLLGWCYNIEFSLKTCSLLKLNCRKNKCTNI